jgi:polyisoprenoid-binding protein YceI
MATRYRIEPADSRFEVQAFVTGMLARLGHSPTFAVREYAGAIRLDGEGPGGLEVELTARADSLELLDRVKPADRAEIMDRMRREVLEVATFPEIAFETEEAAAEPIEGGHRRVVLGGRLTLHGVTRRHGIDAELQVYSDGVRLVGETPLPMPAHRIRPVTALGGAIRLKDVLRVTFDLVALGEAS